MKEKNTALIGIGNILRGDDGLGNYIIKKIEQLQIKNVKTFIVHQLHIELLEELKGFDTVIFVDASLKNDEVLFKEITSLNLPVASSSSHHIDAETFVHLSKKLYQTTTFFYSCEVKGYDFDISEKISPQAKINAQQAVEKILSFI